MANFLSGFDYSYPDGWLQSKIYMYNINFLTVQCGIGRQPPVYIWWIFIHCGNVLFKKDGRTHYYDCCFILPSSLTLSVSEKNSQMIHPMNVALKNWSTTTSSRHCRHLSGLKKTLNQAHIMKTID